MPTILRSAPNLLVITLLLTACPGDLGTPVDSGPGGDSTAAGDTWAPGDQLVTGDGSSAGADAAGAGDAGSSGLSCAGDCSDYVMDRILLPKDSATSAAYGLSLGGKSYNAFGDLMVLLGSVSSSLNLQQEVDESVYGGKTLMLFRVKAKSLTNTSGVKAQAWLGDRMTCCTSTSLATCLSQAKTKCFNGSTAMSPANDSPKNMSFSGGIQSGFLQLGPALLTLKLDINNLGTLVLVLKQVTVKGSISSTGIQNGTLSGAVPSSEMDAKVIPELVKLVNNLLADTSRPKSTRDLIRNLLDSNKDGKISAAELKANPLLKNILGGDVDVDNDGKKDFSLGLGFTAVRCIIAGV